MGLVPYTWSKNSNYKMTSPSSTEIVGFIIHLNSGRNITNYKNGVYDKNFCYNADDGSKLWDISISGNNLTISAVLSKVYDDQVRGAYCYYAK